MPWFRPLTQGEALPALRPATPARHRGRDSEVFYILPRVIQLDVGGARNHTQAL